jgi:hypothetical protein
LWELPSPVGEWELIVATVSLVIYVTVSANFAPSGGGADNKSSEALGSLCPGLAVAAAGSLDALAAGLGEAPDELLGVLCPQAANNDIHKTRQRISEISFFKFCIFQILLTFLWSPKRCDGVYFQTMHFLSQETCSFSM